MSFLSKLSLRDIVPPKAWRELRKAGYRTGRAALRAQVPWIGQVASLTDGELSFDELAWLFQQLELLRNDPRLPPRYREQIEAMLLKVLR